MFTSTPPKFTCTPNLSGFTISFLHNSVRLGESQLILVPLHHPRIRTLIDIQVLKSHSPCSEVSQRRMARHPLPFLRSLRHQRPQRNGRRPWWRSSVSILTDSTSNVQPALWSSWKRPREQMQVLMVSVSLQYSTTNNFYPVSSNVWRLSRVLRGHLL